MQCIKMLNLSMFKLIKHLTEKSKGLGWGTEYLFFFLLSSPQAPIIIYHGGGGWMIWRITRFSGGLRRADRKNIAEP